MKKIKQSSTTQTIARMKKPKPKGFAVIKHRDPERFAQIVKMGGNATKKSRGISHYSTIGKIGGSVKRVEK